MQDKMNIGHKTGSNYIECKQYFIKEENFNLLKRYQREILDATETSPSLRKIDLLSQGAKDWASNTYQIAVSDGNDNIFICINNVSPSSYAS